MIGLSRLYLSAALLAFPSWAQDAAGISAPVRDLGRVRPGVTVTETFRFRNPGPGTVNLLEFRPECGCLSARASRNRLAPGETAEILVSFDPPPMEGPVSKSLTVLSDAPGQARIQLVLKADVRADISLSANQVAFRDLARDGGGLAEVLLEDRRGVDVRISALRTSAAYLTAVPVRQGRNVLLRIRLDGAGLPAAAGRGADWVEVLAANPEPSAFRIQVLWTSKAPAGSP